MADSPAEIPAHHKLRADALQGEAAFTADSLDVTHTHSSSQSKHSSLLAPRLTPSTFLPFKYIFLSFLLFPTSLLLPPPPPQPQPFLDHHHHHHSREGSMQKRYSRRSYCLLCVPLTVGDSGRLRSLSTETLQHMRSFLKEWPQNPH